MNTAVTKKNHAYRGRREKGMKKLLKNIIGSIANFFNRMTDQEAERVIELYRQVFEPRLNKEKGGI